MLRTVESPVGRIIKGDFIEGSDKDKEGNPYRDNDGNPFRKYWLFLAIEKSNPELQAFQNEIGAEAMEHFKSGEYNHSGFAWKYFDGDFDSNGQPVDPENPSRGHMVFRLETRFAPKIYVFQNGAFVETTNVKVGDYVSCSVGIKGHNHAKNNSMFLNLNMIQFAAFGKAIAIGPDPNKVFTNRNHYMPAGASSTPVTNAPLPQQVPGVPQQQVPGVPQQSQQQVPGVPQQSQQQPTGYVNQTAGQNFTNQI